MTHVSGCRVHSQLSKENATRAAGLVVLLAAIALLLQGCATSSVPGQADPSMARRPRAELAIRAGRILDPVSGRYTPPATLLIGAGKILEIGGADEFRAGLADSLVDLAAYTVLPGLIDAHVHLVIGGPVAANALSDLRAGFTTVVDLGARTHRLLQLRDSINRGFIPGPRVLAAGIWVGAKGGVCEFNGIGIGGGVEEFRARIRANAAAGAEVAKLCVSGWPAQAFADPANVELTPDVLRGSVAEAHERNQVSVAHAISLGAARASLEAGVNGLAHAAFVDSATALGMRRAGMFMIPTLASLTAGDTSRVAPALVSAVTLAHRLGVRMVFGTDGGVLPHGRNAEEFQALVSAGLSPLDAIRAATVNAAAAFRIQDSVGVVRAGMVADLVAVAGDPLSDVASLTRPVLVLSRGRVVR